MSLLLVFVNLSMGTPEIWYVRHNLNYVTAYQQQYLEPSHFLSRMYSPTTSKKNLSNSMLSLGFLCQTFKNYDETTQEYRIGNTTMER